MPPDSCCDQCVAQPPVDGFFSNRLRAVSSTLSAILLVSIVSVPFLMACLIDSTWPTSISAAPDAARLRNDDDSPDKFTFASPAEPPALCAGAFEALAAAAVALSPCCVRCAPSCNDDTLELLVESIFTIG